MKVKSNKGTAQNRQHARELHADTSRLPVDARTGQPLAPRTQPGYYAGFQTLSQQAFWDEATRTVVLARVEQVPAIRFFSSEEARLMQAVCDRLMPQDDRDEGHKIPLVNYIDERLFNGRIDGYRFEDMPPDSEAHRLGLQVRELLLRDLDPDQRHHCISLEFYLAGLVRMKCPRHWQEQKLWEQWIARAKKKCPLHYLLGSDRDPLR